MKTKYLIIGAGISGLAFANFCKDDYLIIEKEESIGGFCRTIKQDGYIWDYAGHFYHFKTDEMKKMFNEYMSDEKIIRQVKNTKIYYKDELINYPFQSHIHELPKEEFIECLYDLYNKEEKDCYNSFLDMLYGKFGKAIVEKFLKPYNEKLYACDLNNLDSNAMGRFFPYANISQIISNMKNDDQKSYNDEFLYPENGAQAFIDKIYENLDSNKVFTSTSISKVNVKEHIAITDKNQEIEYEYLINTAPLNEFIKIVDMENDFEEDLSYNKVLVFNLGFEKKSNFKEHWIYVPDKTVNFYRIGFYDNILNSDKLSMYVEIGFSKNDEINVEDELSKTIENLKKMKIVENNELKSYSTIIMNPAYVHINEVASSKITKYMDKMAQNNIYSIGRYGGWTYCSMEDCMLEAKKIIKKISEERSEECG